MGLRFTVSLLLGTSIHLNAALVLYCLPARLEKASLGEGPVGPEVEISISDVAGEALPLPPALPIVEDGLRGALGPQKEGGQHPWVSHRRSDPARTPVNGFASVARTHAPQPNETQAGPSETKAAEPASEELPFSGVLRRPGEVYENEDAQDAQGAQNATRRVAVKEGASVGAHTGGKNGDVGGVRAALAEHDAIGGGLYIGKYVLYGGPPIETINRILQENVHNFTRCYEQDVKDHPSANGSLRTQFRVNTQGIAIVDTTEINGKLSGATSECVENAIHRLRFPPMQKDISLSQTFGFAQSCTNCGLEHVVWLR
jgi:hypothetical protein